MNNHEILKMFFHKSLILYVGILIILLLLLFGYEIFFVKSDFSDIVDLLIFNLITVISSILIFNLIYEVIGGKYNREETSAGIVNAMLLNNEVLNRFDEKLKIQYILTLIESIGVPQNGDVLKMVILPYFTSKTFLRVEFKNSIKFQNISLGSLWTSLDPLKYLLRQEYLSFTRVFVKAAPNYQELIYDKPYKIAFCRDPAFFSGLFGDVLCIFRGMLYMDDDDYKCEFTDATYEEIIRKTGVKLQINGKESKPVIELTQVNEEGVIICFESFPDETETVFSIDLCIPLRKKDIKHQLSIYEPTNNIDIGFHFPSDQFTVDTFSFFDTNFENLNISEGTVRIRIKKWIMPRTGVTFLLKPKEILVDNSE